MNLLPKSRTEFSEESYWNKFFRNRGTKSFEWYGEYLQLCGLLHKYMKPKDLILVIGCGNSNLSADLYDVGYREITNIDISDVVIKQMQNLHSSQRPQMKFLRMDLLEMNFQDEAFTCVLDKGTLDALMTDSNPEVQQKVDKIFEGISRVLRVGGRYICISLLQECILQKILTWFQNEGWMIRICRCFQAESKEDYDGIIFPVFVVICTKLRKMPDMKPVLELGLSEECAERVQDMTQVIKSVRAVQQYAFIRYQLSRGSVADDVISLDLYDSSANSPRYSLFIVDRPKQATNRFAIFIVPQGRETEWLFASHEGHQQLSTSAGVERLIVVHLRREHVYKDLDTVKEELSGKVMELAPLGLPSNVKVPFLSIGEDIGQRDIRYSGNSELSGAFVVEDVLADEGQMCRRLIFCASRDAILSEAKLKKGRSRGKGGKVKLVVDRCCLASQCHVAMVAALGFLPPHLLDRNTALKILVIGLGGGGLCTFLHQHFEKIHIDVVEVDPVIVTIAKDHFGFTPDRRMKVHIADGLQFISECSAEGIHYDLIMCDVTNKDTAARLNSPPRPFVEREFLTRVKMCLNPEGVFVLNLECRDTKLQEEVLQDMRDIFATLVTHSADVELREILFCSVKKLGKNIRVALSEALTTINNLVKRKQAGDEDLIRVTEMIKNLQIESSGC